MEAEGKESIKNPISWGHVPSPYSKKKGFSKCISIDSEWSKSIILREKVQNNSFLPNTYFYVSEYSASFPYQYLSLKKSLVLK